MKPVRREDGRMVLNIDNEKDLRTYMQPQRLSILFELESRPEGMTAKQLADALGIAPSARWRSRASWKKRPAAPA